MLPAFLILRADDWEIWHNKGLCLMHLKDYEKAAESLKRANIISKHDSTYLLQGRLFALQENYKGAIDCLMEGLEYVLSCSQSLSCCNNAQQIFTREPRDINHAWFVVPEDR